MMRQLRRGGGMPGMPGHARHAVAARSPRAAPRRRREGQGEVGQPRQAGPAGAGSGAADRGGAAPSPGGAFGLGAGAPDPARARRPASCPPASRSSSAADAGEERASGLGSARARHPRARGHRARHTLARPAPARPRPGRPRRRAPGGVGRRRPDHATQAPLARTDDGVDRPGLGAARPGRRALPRRPRRRTAPSTTATAEQQALADRDAGRAAAARRRLARRHPLDRRPRRPAAARSGPAGTSPGPGATSATTPTRSSRTSWSTYVAQEARARRRLGQAGRRLDRPRRRRPRRRAGRADALARGDRGGPRGGRPGHRALLRRGVAAATCSRPASTASSTRTGLHRRDRSPTFAARGVADRADPGQHRQLPELRRRPARQVPALRRAHASTCTRGATTRVAAAHEAGVPIYVGTDAGGALPHGLVADEVAELVARRPAAHLAPSTPPAGAPASGWAGPALEEGAPADLVVYDADPREDIGRAGRPRLVVLRGRPVP